MSDQARAVQERYQYRDRALALVRQLRRVRDELNGAIDATLDRERETADLAVQYEAERDALALQLQAALAEVERARDAALKQAHSWQWGYTEAKAYHTGREEALLSEIAKLRAVYSDLAAACIAELRAQDNWDNGIGDNEDNLNETIVDLSSALDAAANKRRDAARALLAALHPAPANG